MRPSARSVDAPPGPVGQATEGGRASTYVLHAGGARVSVAPGHGCLIAEIDPGKGNLLWADGRAARVLQPSGLVGEESAREFDEELLLGGWFPMFPTAGIPTATTQQHGWAPRVAWTVVERTAAGMACTVSGPFLDGGVAEVTRSIRLEPDALTVSSIVKNVGTEVRSFTWGEHPCFSRDVFAAGEAVFAGDRVAAVPRHADGIAGHLSRSARGATAAVHGSQMTVALTDTVCTLPHWLFWYNYAADELPRADTLAWEPSTAAGMGVGEAIAAGAVNSLGPDECFHATLRCEWTFVDNPVGVGTMT